MNEWHCCLVCEGSSDAALTNVLELLLIRLTSETRFGQREALRPADK